MARVTVEIASTRLRTASSSCCWPAIAPAPFRPVHRSHCPATTDKNPVVALREIAEETVATDDLKEEFIHSLQKYVEVDEPELDQVPLIASAGSDDDAGIQFDRMSEEELLKGLEGLVPPDKEEEDLSIAVRRVAGS